VPPFEATWKLWAKGVGLVILVAHLWHYPPTIEWAWVAAYFGLGISVGFVFRLFLNPIIDRLLPSQKLDFEAIGGHRLQQARRNRWLEALLLPGEDGLFFVPLLLVGSNWLTAGVVAPLYAAMHYPEFPLRLCVVKAVFIYLIALLILPHGLGTVIVGHLLLDTVGYLLWRSTPPPVRSASADSS
jgi:hypothetical protein